MGIREAEWHKLPISLTELCINTTLRCGQSFRWRKSAEHESSSINHLPRPEWSCALHGRILSLRQDSHTLHYRAIFPPSKSPNPNDDDTLALIKHYFNLNLNLGQLYTQWASTDSNFAKRAPNFTGVRILRQDPWETLLSFICSSNNHISRISSMVSNLCLHYGPLIGYIDDVPYHDFPPPEALAHPKVEEHLKQLGFGYRAKYIYKTAVMVSDKGDGLDWLDGLCNPESPAFGKELGKAGSMEEGGREGYRKAHQELLALHGVGPKVADCVCLMGLGWSESVPVDTHVWQIAQRDYKFGKGKHSSLTPATYNAVANHFRKIWGKEAGWAHSVLFTADLKSFSDRLVVKTEEAKDEVKEEEVMLKTEVKTEPIDDIEAEETAVKPETGIKVETKEEPVVKSEPDIDTKDVPSTKRTRATTRSSTRATKRTRG